MFVILAILFSLESNPLPSSEISNALAVAIIAIFL